MRKKTEALIACLMIALMVTGCGESEKLTPGEAKNESLLEIENVSEGDKEENKQPDDEVDPKIADEKEDISIEAFLNGEIPAYSIYEDGTISEEWISDIEFKDDDWNYYKMGEKKDVDNDGEEEQIIDGPMGGFYLDRTDDKILISRPGEYTYGNMEFIDKEDGCWIKYQDTGHVGRSYFEMIKMKGSEIEEDIKFNSYDEYKEDGSTVDHTVYQINDEEVTKEEFDKKTLEYLGF